MEERVDLSCHRRGPALSPTLGHRHAPPLPLLRRRELQIELRLQLQGHRPLHAHAAISPATRDAIATDNPRRRRHCSPTKAMRLSITSSLR